MDCNTNDQQQQQHQQQLSQNQWSTIPKLYPDLKLALAVLYSLQPPSPSINYDQNNYPTNQQAHDYLIEFQSRNTRRKIGSIQQRIRDQQNGRGKQIDTVKKESVTTTAPSNNTNGNQFTGSTWLACLALLCSEQSNSTITTTTTTERMFAAQTILQRIRKTKIVECIDIELEQHTILSVNPNQTDFSITHLNCNDENSITNWITNFVQFKNHHVQILQQSYILWLKSINPFIGYVLESYFAHRLQNLSSSCDTDDYEQLIKGEMTLITLTSLIFYLATSTANDTQNSTNVITTKAAYNIPLLSTCMSSLILIATRIRFSQNAASKVNTTPIVTTIQQSFGYVWQIATQCQYIPASASSSSSLSEYEKIFITIQTMCIGCIPDTIMGCTTYNSGGSSGGSRVKFSFDPRCIEESIHELRTIDSINLCTVLQQILYYSSITNGNNATKTVSDIERNQFDILLIETCTKWISYIQLSIDLLRLTMSRVQVVLTSTISNSNNTDQQLYQQQQQQQRIAMLFLIALFEAGSWTEEQVLSSFIGFNTNSQQQQQSSDTGNSNRIKQSSKSKKRQKEIVDQKINSSHLQQAQQELQVRGEISCHALLQVWDVLNYLVTATLAQCNASPHMSVDGEGPIGCFIACTNACIPHILKRRMSSSIDASSSTTGAPNDTLLFQNTITAFLPLCASPNKAVRALTYESLYTIHAVVVDSNKQNKTESNSSGISHDDENLQSMIIDFFFKSTMSLASQCSYPDGYFNILSEPSDEELEIERNDVRDILRTVTASTSNGIEDDKMQTPVTRTNKICLQILHRLLTACQEVILVDGATTEDKQAQLLFPETAAHAFSSLAKPLSHVAELYVSNVDRSDMSKQILLQGLTILVNASIAVTRTFHNQSTNGTNVSFQQLFSCCRVVTISIASLAPMLSSSCYDSEMMNGVIQALPYLLECSILSLEHFPELYAPSILEHSMYEIRGAMRGPGGDDHVGCLALKRLSTESDILTQHVIVAMKPFTNRLCILLEQMKILESTRGKGIAYGNAGVTPQSRRILLNILCTMELKSQGGPGMSQVVSAVYNLALDSICASDVGSYDEPTLFYMCENTLDIAMFPPEIIISMFCADDKDKATQSLHILATACIQGYRSNVNGIEAYKEWARLRAALFMVLQRIPTTAFPMRASEILTSFIRAECDAIIKQCTLGPNCASCIFCEDVVSPEGIPSSLYIRTLLDAITSAKPSVDLQGLGNVIRVVCDCKDVVLACITHRCGDPDEHVFADPRPALAECWFLLMTTIINSKLVDSSTEVVLVDSFAAFVSMLFYPSMEKTLNARRMDPGMSLDGAQSLAALSFVEHFLRLGHDMLYKAGQKILSVLPIDVAEFRKWHNDDNLVGIAIIGAAFFRANQGSLPPWAVETVPDIYSALFQSLRKDVSLFATVIRLSMEIRLANVIIPSFPSLKPGQLVSGRIFEGISEKAKTSFVTDVMTVCEKDDAASWRRMKAIVKQACGGKKKETDFSQKPSFTKWDFFRV